MIKKSLKLAKMINSLKQEYITSELRNDYIDGCNCAIDCINDGINTRKYLFTDMSEDFSPKNIVLLFNDLIDSLKSVLIRMN